MKVSAPIIRKLDENTINRIAAGEVVQHPCAAIKEMLENSLDAGSSVITITVKGGGLQLLQIQDNGHGIRKQDLGILCERFTTSKLKCFEDLKTIATFGFRGEALASITHVSHVTIVTRTSDQPCAYKARYLDGKLVPLQPGDKCDPKACAGTIGTTITVENLYYNMQTRRQAFNTNINENYQRIVDVANKYAIHYGDQGVSLTCKKQGAITPDVHTTTQSSIIDNIKVIYGVALGNELKPFQFSCGNINDPSISTLPSESNNDGGTDTLAFSCQGYVSNPNYSRKKGVYIFFINNRLVECQSIKKTIELIYKDILPKHSHPFIYLSFHMPTHHVDVNVHPTKKEVQFMYEEELLLAMYKALTNLLVSANESRVFYTQTSLLPTISSSSVYDNKFDSCGEKGENENGDGDEQFSRGHICRDEASRSTVPFSDLSCVDEDLDTDFMSTSVSKNNDSSGNSDNVYDVNESPKLVTSGDSSTGIPMSRESSMRITSNASAGARTQGSSSQSRQASKLVRVDSSIAKIDSFFLKESAASSSSRSHSNEIPVLAASKAHTVTNDSLRATSVESMCLNGSGDSVIPGAFAKACPCCVVPEVAAVTSIESVEEAECEVDLDGVPELTSGKKRTLSMQEESEPEAPREEGVGDAKRFRLMPKLPHIVDSTNVSASVKTLQTAIYDQLHPGLANILKRHSLVGVVNDRFLLLQVGTRLLMADYKKMQWELCRQLLIRQTGALPIFALSPPPSLLSFLRVAIDSKDAEWTAEDGNKDALLDRMTEIFRTNRLVLQRMFGIEIDDQLRIQTLPDLLPGLLTPAPESLPMFFLRLTTEVDWTSDEAIIATCVAEEIAHLYCSRTMTAVNTEDKFTSNIPGLDPSLAEKVIWPMIKEYLVPTKALSDQTDLITQVAALEQLYKVFERC